MIEVKEGKLIGKNIFGVKDGLYYSLEEFCIIHNLKEETVRQWRHRGFIRAVSVFGKTYIPVDEPPHEGKNGRPKGVKRRSKT